MRTLKVDLTAVAAKELGADYDAHVINIGQALSCQTAHAEQSNAHVAPRRGATVQLWLRWPPAQSEPTCTVRICTSKVPIPTRKFQPRAEGDLALLPADVAFTRSGSRGFD